MNLREWALSQGIHPQTAYRWYRQGKLPVPAQKMGKLILVGDLEATTQASPGRAAVYARVSSADQRADLDRQVARVVAWATEHGHSVDQVIAEVGPALNGHRRKFLALLRDRSIDTILVEHSGPVLSLRSRVRRGRTRGPGSSPGRRGPVGGGR